MSLIQQDKVMNLVLWAFTSSQISLVAATKEITTTRCVTTQKSEVLIYFAAEASWLLKMGPISCPETSTMNYSYSLGNNPEECSSHLTI